MDTVDLEVMTQEQYEAWLPGVVAVYAHENVVIGRWSEAEAFTRSTEEHQKLLPQGPGTPDHHLWSIVRTGDRQPVGVLWMREMKTPMPHAFIYYIEIDPQFRRRGYARQAMTKVENEVKRLGLESIGLDVLGHNTAARPLYEELGYAATNIRMTKRLR